MQAFPKDSANMQLGGSGPNNSRLNLDQFHGRGQDAYNDYSTSAVVDETGESLRRPNTTHRAQSFNPTDRTEAVHGDLTEGLGTSTFLEGAPASRAAIQRRESENRAAMEAEQQQQGLSRKKSIAQKIRAVRPRNTIYGNPDGVGTPTSPLGTGRSESNNNPFFKGL